VKRLVPVWTHERVERDGRAGGACDLQRRDVRHQRPMDVCARCANGRQIWRTPSRSRWERRAPRSRAADRCSTTESCFASRTTIISSRST
jgi:hypothetical protein